MSFVTWMNEIGLSDSTIKKYHGAIDGALSEWARDVGIIKGSILSISSVAYFNIVAKEIQSLPIFIERNYRGHHMYSSAMKQYGEYLQQNPPARVEEDLDYIVSDLSIDATEQVRRVKSRLGQSIFRKSVVNYWKGCSVTGYKDTSLLVASHIKPWAISSDYERLDKFNGLLLLPNLDKLFDKGLISFKSDGQIIISKVLDNPSVFGVSTKMSVQLVEQHKVYMAYHRNNIFVDL